VTQPRRVAAINLAKRVADETKTTLGQDVTKLSSLACCVLLNTCRSDILYVSKI
jgi:hypothetical protein